MCGKRLKSFEIWEHKKYVLGAEANVCDQCGRFSKSTDMLKEHIEKFHGTDGNECDQCGKSFNPAQLLQYKAEVHEPSLLRRFSPKRKISKINISSFQDFQQSGLHLILPENHPWMEVYRMIQQRMDALEGKYNKCVW